MAVLHVYVEAFSFHNLRECSPSPGDKDYMPPPSLLSAPIGKLFFIYVIYCKCLILGVL